MVDKLFELALFIGMTPEQFWVQDPSLFWVYKRVKENIVREEIDRLNYSAWLYGLYVREAIVSSFNDKHRYPSEPLSTGIKEISEEEVKKKEEKEIRKTYNQLKNWSSSFKGNNSKDTKND